MSVVFSGTDFDNVRAYLSVNPRIAYQSPVKTGDRWLTILIEEKPGNVGLLLKEGNVSHGDWMRVNILVTDDEESIRFSFGGFL